MERANEALIELVGDVQSASDPMDVGEFLERLADPYGGVLPQLVSVLAEASRWCARKQHEHVGMADLADRLRDVTHRLIGTKQDLNDVTERLLTPAPPALRPPSSPGPAQAPALPPSGPTPPGPTPPPTYRPQR